MFRSYSLFENDPKGSIEVTDPSRSNSKLSINMQSRLDKVYPSQKLETKKRLKGVKSKLEYIHKK